MVTKTECYVDTSALIAFLDRSDSFHPLFRRLFSKPPKLATSSLVIAEGHGWFLRRYDQDRAIQFLGFVAALPNFSIEPFDQHELESATTFVMKFRDQKLTMADAHGLSLMKRRKIQTCWSTDRHLSLTGVPLVI